MKYILTAIVIVILLAFTLAPFMVSGAISREEEKRELEARLRAEEENKDVCV